MTPATRQRQYTFASRQDSIHAFLALRQSKEVHPHPTTYPPSLPLLNQQLLSSIYPITRPPPNPPTHYPRSGGTHSSWRGGLQIHGFEDEVSCGRELDDLSGHETKLLIIVQYGVHVLDPHRVHRTVKYQPLPVWGLKRKPTTIKPHVRVHKGQRQMLCCYYYNK